MKEHRRVRIRNVAANGLRVHAEPSLKHRANRAGQPRPLGSPGSRLSNRDSLRGRGQADKHTASSHALTSACVQEAPGSIDSAQIEPSSSQFELVRVIKIESEIEFESKFES